MRCIYRPRWTDKMFNLYSITDYNLIDGKRVTDKVYIGYLNLFGFRFRFKFYMERVR